MISEKQEIEMGERAGKALEAQYGLYQDDEVASRIDRIGKALAAHSTRQIPYTFKVLNTQDVNALACPGGFIYVYKGLVDTMTSDDELAAVLGHEIGHIEKRHTVHQIENRWPCPFLPSLLARPAGILAQDWPLLPRSVRPSWQATVGEMSGKPIRRASVL